MTVACKSSPGPTPKADAFDRELEIYNEAGIPASEVLRIATIEAARLMHQDQDFGSIAPGKYSDMILVNGDRTRRRQLMRHSKPDAVSVALLLFVHFLTRGSCLDFLSSGLLLLALSCRAP